MIDMRRRSLLRTSDTWHIWLIGMAIITSLVVGGSYLVYPSSFSPLFVGGVIAAIVIGIAWLRKPVWALYAAIFVVLLPQGLFPEHINDILSRSFLLIALGTWLIDVIVQRRRIVWTHTALLMLGFLVWSIVTLTWTPNLDLGMERVVQYALRLILSLLLIANEITTKETLDGLMRTLALNGWVLVFAGLGTILLEGYETGTRLRVLGEQVNKLGILLIVTMPGVLWQVIRASGQRKSLQMALSIIFLLLAILLVVLSGSRGSAVTLFASLLAFCIWKPTRRWGTLGLLVLVVAAVTAPFIYSVTVERFVDQASGILGGRVPIWKAAWMLIRDHFWNGVGIGNSRYAVMPYYERLIGVWREDSRSIHNPVLAIWAETGFPGMLLYLGVLGSAIWSFIRWVYHRSWTYVPFLKLYFALVSSIFLGYMLSWVKVGGIEYHRSYFLVLALLLIPSHLDFDELKQRTTTMFGVPAEENNECKS